jgi:hypothetical protein
VPITAIPPSTKSRRFSLLERLRSTPPCKPPRHPSPQPYPISIGSIPVVFHANHNHTLPCGTQPCHARHVSERSGVGAVADGAWEAGEARTVAQRSYSPACTARVRAGPAKGWTVAMRLRSTGSGMGSASGTLCRTAALAFALASPSVPAPTSGYGDGGGMDAQLDGSPIHEPVSCS